MDDIFVKIINVFRYVIISFFLFILMGAFFPFMTEANIDYSTALLMELIITILHAVFVIKPLSRIIGYKTGTETKWFVTLLVLRIVALLVININTPGFCVIDFLLMFLGIGVVLPIIAQVTNTNSILRASSSSSSSYASSDDKVVLAHIERLAKKCDLDLDSDFIPNGIIKRKKVFMSLYAFLVFIYVSLIFFHFPIYTYVIGFIILIVLLLVTIRYDVRKYILKLVKQRPEEKITNILMQVKDDKTNNSIKAMSIVKVGLAIFIALVFFIHPRIWYEQASDGVYVRYYIFGLTNFTSAEIPETHHGKEVVGLRGNAFSNMPFLKKVILPDTIKEIRGQAFLNDANLISVNIPKNLTYLGGGAFKNCKKLTYIEFPDSLTYIGGESFMNDTNLVSVKLPSNLSEIRGDTFNNCQNLRSINIPDSVTRIGGHAFYGNYSLSEVTISPNSKLDEIGSSAFRQCYSLKEIYLPSGTYINERAFKESPTSIYKYTTND